MNAALARPHLAPRHRQSLHFALGKAHDDMGDYEAAMRNFEAGNRLRARGGHFDRDALVRRIDQLIEATPPGYRDRQPDPGVEDATPVLIVGMPRSGSTLTEQILSSHPEVAAGGELEFWRVRDTPRQDTWSLAATAESARASRRRLSGDAASVRAGREADHRQGAQQLHAARVHPPRLPQRDPHPLPAPSDRHSSIDLHHELRDELGYRVRTGATWSSTIRQYQRLMAHWREVLPPTGSSRWTMRRWSPTRSRTRGDSSPSVASSGTTRVWRRTATPAKIKTASIWQARQPIYRTSVERWRRYEPWLGELRGLASEAYALHSLLSRHDRDMTKS